jgi:undecaprenyl diphosphate synthase
MAEIKSKYTPEDYKEKAKLYEYGSRKVEGVPRHVAVICDGNRRWARERGLEEYEGHVEGADNIMDLMTRAGELGIDYFTVWVGDTKNIQKRSKEEVKNLMKIFLYYGKLFRQEFLTENIRFRHTGAKKLLPKKVLDLIHELESETAHKDGPVFNVAFNYGGRDEILRAVQQIVKDNVNPNDIDEALFESYLDTNDIPDPDMIIRTGKEVRLSGFMSWESAPSELFFPQDLFPDYTPDKFETTVLEFLARNRRLGV